MKQRWAFKQPGFTVVELLIALGVIAILVTISILLYRGTQRQGAESAVTTDIKQATQLLSTMNTFGEPMPDDIYDIINPSPQVQMTLMPASGGVFYDNLTEYQNARLFLDLCNSVMPIKSGSYEYATNCVGQWGVDITGGSHSSYLSHSVVESFTLVGVSCLNPNSNPSYCLPYHTVATEATNTLRNTFLAQGGQFPVRFTNNPATSLPTPTQVGPEGDFCLQASHATYTDIIFHSTASAPTPQPGGCS